MHLSYLKKYCFIDQFNQDHLKNLKKNITLIWRSKYKQDDLKLIKKLAFFCKTNKINLFLSNNVKLAIKLKLDGVYISAHNRDYRFNNYKLKKNFKIIGSAHNLIELNIKKQQNIKEIFISPIFKYKNRSPIGIHKCKYFFKNDDYKAIALGGVSEKNINLLKLTKFKGFAGINIFKKKGPKLFGAF